MSWHQFHDNITTLLDIVFCALIVYFALFMVSFIQIAVDKQKKKVDSHAEIQIVVTWPDDFDDDVDTYVGDPSGRILSYSGQDVGLMSLDRDDRGKMTDLFWAKYGNQEVQYEENREIVTIRGTEVGEYAINVQMFAKRPDKRKTPTPVKVTIEKMNPRVSLIKQKTVFLKKRGDEITICRFTVNADGSICNVNEKHKSLIRQRAEQLFDNPYPDPTPPGDYRYDPPFNESTEND